MGKSNFIAAITGILLTAGTITACSQGAVIKASKKHISKEVKVENFHGIHLVGSTNVTYQQDTRTQVKISGPDNIVPLVEAIVENGTLIIKMKKGVSIMNSGNLNVKVSSPDLNKLAITGSGDVVFANGIETQGNLQISITGSGDIKGSSFNCRNMEVSITGSGDIDLQNTSSTQCSANISGSGDISLSGKTTDAQYRVSGSGDINAANLKAINVSATSSGSGDISCSASGKLSARVQGSGDVSYKGNPKEINSPKKGLHKID